MASSDRPDGDDQDVPNPYVSANRWRHQESRAYARHAARAAVPSDSTNELADFLNQSRIEPSPPGSHDDPGYTSVIVAAAEARAARAGDGGGAEQAHAAAPDAPRPDGKDVVCGPLLNYRSMEGARWVGSVLVVVKGGGLEQPFVPTLEIRPAPLEGSNDADDGGGEGGGGVVSEVRSECLYSDMRSTFWQFDVVVEMAPDASTAWEYVLPGLRFSNAAAAGSKPQRNRFFVPAVNESMRVMFHSCNGFSVGTDEDAWSGPALWKDVLRRHAELPIHVMIGGGDQIYNDGIRVNGPLRQWTDIKSPKKRAEYPFPEKLRRECDDFYLKNYLRWYSTGAFAVANGQIAQLNIWDDHDIIDGFGSYVDRFMRCDVFRGIGGTAHKYYLLFQHHLAPPPSTYTTDAPETTAGTGQGIDPNQLVDTYVAPARADISAYIMGQKPGPYVAEHSCSMFARLGARISFVGIDARTERTRHQVNYPETYDLIFTRLRTELQAAADAGQPTRHLILLLGIPIAYPRLTWLENVLRSPVIGPIKFLHRRFGVGGGLFNHFDGSVDLLDDLDDHYTARTHKAERRQLVERLQGLAAQYSVRVTILGGDVHLAALGRFYSRLDLGIPAENDARFMVNAVSSAITNKPPPQAIANLLARRNKIHHLDEHTDETLLDLFNKDPGQSTKTAKHNHCTMPSRNYALITENSPNNSSNNNGDARIASGSAGHPDTQQQQQQQEQQRAYPGKNGHSPIHAGELNCGTEHKAVRLDSHGRGSDGSLDVCLRVEIDQHDRDGHTQGYGLTVPPLEAQAAPQAASTTGPAAVETVAPEGA